MTCPSCHQEITTAGCGCNKYPFGINDNSHYMNPLEVNDLILKSYERGQKEGYDRGYFQAREDLMKDEPDGWCFHHDKLGWFWKEPDDPYHKEEMQRLGYTIVPVKLIRLKDDHAKES